ncbi:DUF4367 domain-containing protein [Exiguobacterium sp. SH3S2]|uniref:DUF4367 domain-containing protein n=1 Tax=unclassified Exiguobacterium TaxID=2644629 RepID=UPI00103FA453|nr:MULTISPECIES: DUF4367 domain-containing protein [unclassified Exiguobacterium]TCI47204.1 DUF4367 domain-containing protein [Exiguobacterium sp. SH3S3]TCI62352.1 DUF4367 domain-containing protein [Exiguobacterium sp. SH3S2]
MAQHPKQRTSRRTFKIILAMIFALLVVGRVPIQMPIAFTTSFVPFEVETPSYLPLEIDEQYSHLLNLNQVRLVYKNETESITVWATSEIGWNHVDSWDEKVMIRNGLNGHYTEFDDMKMISWQQENVEYAVDYTGTQLSKDDLLKIANSIQ